MNEIKKLLQSFWLNVSKTFNLGMSVEREIVRPWVRALTQVESGLIAGSHPDARSSNDLFLTSDSCEKAVSSLWNSRTNCCLTFI